MEKTQNAQSEPSEFGEHIRAASREAVKQWKSLIPQDFWDHGRTARREMLLAMRSLVDAAIEHLEEKEGSGNRANARRKAKVEVE